MRIHPEDTALVVTDPQNDFLSEHGVAWELVGDSVRENRTIENLERLFVAAKTHGYTTFISPHYYYPTDHDWKFQGALEKVMHDIGMFDRKGPLTLEGFPGSGADWLERFTPYIRDAGTVIASPHKVYGPENNDLMLQLAKRNMRKVLLCGMSANLCVEAHMRELIERGFEVAIVKDATAAARHPTMGDGYKAALINFGFIASAVLTTEDAVKAMGSHSS